MAIESICILDIILARYVTVAKEGDETGQAATFILAFYQVYFEHVLRANNFQVFDDNNIELFKLNK